MALGTCVWRWRSVFGAGGGAFGAGEVHLALGAASDISDKIIAYALC